MDQNDIENILQIVEILKKMQHRLNEEWKKANYPVRNLKRIYISEVWMPTSDVSSEFSIEMRAYSNLANKYSLITEMAIPDCYNIRVRAKQQYSILAKLQKYIEKKEKGKMPICKCLNDLFGARYICNENMDYLEIFSQLNTIFENDNMVRIVKSFHGSYTAVHLYIQEENSTFPWELQIWKQEDEISNENSHKKYKQEYANDSKKY